MIASPSPHTWSPDTAPTPASGLDLAPRGRRWDHILTIATGIVLCPASLVLIGMAETAQADGHSLHAAAMLIGLLVANTAASLLFATRSSVGFLAAGLSALVTQITILLAPGHAASLPSEWVRAAVSNGAALLMAGLWLGASWGMRAARRGGHIQGRLAFRLTQADKQVGTTPAPPPSRRRDHLLSLPWVLLALGAAAMMLPLCYSTVIAPGFRPSPGAYAMVLAILVLLVVSTASTGSSSLGVRVGGPLIVVLALPALLGDGLPGSGLLEWLLPRGPGAVEVISIGLVIMAAGWGAHLARRQGRSTELADLRSAPARLPGRTGRHYGEHTQGGTREH